MNPEALRPLLCVLAACAFSACAPAIGDECQSALDCSSQGSRLCDRTQPHGYCTLRGCEPGTCPEDSLCVKFRPKQERLATTWCMAKCSDDGDCRSDEDYRCTTAKEFGGDEAEILGEVIPDGGVGRGFCSSTAATPEPEIAPSSDSGTRADGND